MSRLRLLLRCQGVSIVFLLHFRPLAFMSQKLLPFLKQEETKKKQSYGRYLLLQTYSDNENTHTPPFHIHIILLQGVQSTDHSKISQERKQHHTI